jgi:ribonuclease D
MKMANESITIQRHRTDIPDSYLKNALSSGVVAWDIETSGLDWRTNEIGTCQLYTPSDSVAVIVQTNRNIPKRLGLLLSSGSVRKVFHHAMFDLRFMAHHWKVSPRNIACTKIASKLLDPSGGGEHSLLPLLRNHLGIEIDKGQQRSNWLSKKLTEAQLSYAVNDVIYLVPLLTMLEKDLDSRGLLGLARACFDHIPTRVQLDLLGYSDVYNYSSAPAQPTVSVPKESSNDARSDMQISQVSD